MFVTIETLSKPRGLFRSLLSIIVFSLIFYCPDVFAQTTKSFPNATAAEADKNSGSPISRTVTVLVSDFPAGETITDVNLTVTFEKLDDGTTTPPENACPSLGGAGHQGADPKNSQIVYTLVSPATTSVSVVAENDYAGTYGGQVAVTFDDAAASGVSGTPTAGTYQPNGAFSSFNGESPTGTWTVQIVDTSQNDPLCHVSYSLEITTNSDITPPVLQSFTSSTPDNTYGPGRSINVTANYDENIQAGSTIDVTLDNGASLQLNNVSGTTISGTYTVGAFGDPEDSADLTVSTITAQSASDTSGNTNSSTTLPGTNIADGSDIVIDTTPDITLSVDTSPIAEAAGVATFTATSNALSTDNITVDLVFTGTATGGSTDYTASGSQITISAGSTTGNITVTADDDSLDEDDETVVVDISGVTNGVESGTQQESTTITDDDAEPSVTLTVDNATIPEDGSTISTFTATLSAVSGRNVTVNLSYSGTATGSGTDYSSSGTSILISAGNNSGTATVTAQDDELFEDDETIIVDIDSVTNGTESGTQQETTQITDDDEDLDSDGDGLTNADECPGESFPCPDSDGDGIPDYLESNDYDTDGDGTKDYLDSDSDGDGTPDGTECASPPDCPDSDGDGLPDYVDSDDSGSGDADGDGIPDSEECPDGFPCPDFDGDGIPDYLDGDSDNDGIDDIDEGTGDDDGDGIPNNQDDDIDGDGILDVDEGPGDSDGDGRPDFRDIDADGDGLTDALEGNSDTDSDGSPQTISIKTQIAMEFLIILNSKLFPVS